MTSRPAWWRCSQGMRRAIFVATVSMPLASCVSGPVSSLFDRTHKVWDEIGRPPEDLPTPNGFTVTPAQAYAIVVGDRLQKFHWSIYADRTGYFLARENPLLVMTSTYARKYGTQLDGTTGKCLKGCIGVLAETSTENR